MDKKIELLINTIKDWTIKYAYKIYVKGKNEEKKEYYYTVTFFHQKVNESISKCTINVNFVITEIELIDLNNLDTYHNSNEKYFITFKFENENLTRTLDMNLNYEAWIDKLIKDKEKLRNKIDLSSEYMKTRFIKPIDEENIQIILNKIKGEREEIRKKNEEQKELKEKKENKLNKIKLYEETHELEKINSKHDSNTSHGNKEFEKGIKKNEENQYLNEVLSFLRNILYFYFIDIDIKKKGKLIYNYYTEILKMVNYKICISYKHLENSLNEREDKEDEFSNMSENFFFYESDNVLYSSTNDSSNEENIVTQNMKKKKNAKDEKKYISNLFNINNKEVNLIKDINIYKNDNFNGSNIFFEPLNKSIINSELFIFDKYNEYNKYIFTDNYYDFLLYISYADEEEKGCINYNDYINNLPEYLYELNRNREYFNVISIDDLVLYKQFIYVCYENELNFMYDCFLNEFKKFDVSDSGYIHRNQLKKILQENDHIISRQEYKLLLHIFDFNDDNYVYYKNIKEIILRLRFEGIKNSIFERDKKLLQKYLCEELIKNNLKNKKKIHIFECKNILDFCDKIYLNKNIIHIILSSLNFDENLELDVTFFLQVSVTIITNSIKLENMHMIYNMITDEKEKKEVQNKESNLYKRKKDNKKIEKANIPALELVERTLTKLFKVLDEKNENYLNINEFIETLLESNKKKKIIDIKEICKLSKNELQGFVAEIDVGSKKDICKKNIKDNENFQLFKNRKIHYESHIHKWCSKTYQIRSCDYYSYFLNHLDNLIELDEEINKSLLFCEEKKEY
ncbi:conserved Plasmodium protein, unknown function [Plasmodium gallinaceum]|uniref:EF-hand domain-containing protein n=1 Tax=Plasmodium gallinaceum TaxID=5849 RepID=A0A1J1GPH8_PLAGA|nr:conserved Plasmodium protein, unknown function [Plasmodium gallinaceum]CRG94206.1 conserved Plasmodium protein, unknown function [Plasmodium gallinaceum]